MVKSYINHAVLTVDLGHQTAGMKVNIHARQVKINRVGVHHTPAVCLSLIHLS
jgi:hypothetical protein